MILHTHTHTHAHTYCVYVYLESDTNILQLLCLLTVRTSNFTQATDIR